MNDKRSSAPTYLEQDRLLSLIEYAKQSAKLRSTPASTVAQHKLFALYEHDLQGVERAQNRVSDTPDGRGRAQWRNRSIVSKNEPHFGFRSDGSDDDRRSGRDY